MKALLRSLLVSVCCLGVPAAAVAQEDGSSMQLLPDAPSVVIPPELLELLGLEGGLLGDEGLALPPIPRPTLLNTLLARAKPDECFVDIGEPYPEIGPNGRCPEGIPKRNGAYVWGLTQEGDKLWFVIVPNVICLGGASFFGAGEPSRTDSYVCEYGESQLAQAGLVPDQLGDWRPPIVYEYNLKTKRLVDRSLPSSNELFYRTLGLRSAGSIDDVVLVAGPTFASTSAVPPIPPSLAFFAYRSSNGEYLGSCEASAFNDIRKWLHVGGDDGVLYAGVGTPTGGAVIRWNGSVSNPFAGEPTTCGFEVVGTLPGGNASELSIYGNDRIAVSAWPSALFETGAGIWISPAFGADGLTAADADNWTHVWFPDDYEPDPVVAATYGGGAVAYYDGWLYWGTMHVPGLSTFVHAVCQLPVCAGGDTEGLFEGTSRNTTIWRGRNLEGPNPDIELLYGETELPAYDPEQGAFVPTGTDWVPVFGPSGFGNPFNFYTWTMAILADRLFVGTLDVSYLFLGDQDGIAPALGLLFYGADLWRFDSSTKPAVAENLSGIGNLLNYGIRTLITLDDGSALIAGTANPFNLAPKGGWELRRLGRHQLLERTRPQ